MRKLRVLGQNVTEYAIILTVLVLAIVGIQTYVKRGLQARYKQGADYVFSDIRQASGKAGAVNQYDPYYSGSSITENRSSEVTVGVPESRIDQRVTRSGWQRIGPAEDVQ